jgi:hypothetical protein
MPSLFPFFVAGHDTRFLEQKSSTAAHPLDAKCEPFRARAPWHAVSKTTNFADATLRSLALGSKD